MSDVLSRSSHVDSATKDVGSCEPLSAARPAFSCHWRASDNLRCLVQWSPIVSRKTICSYPLFPSCNELKSKPSWWPLLASISSRGLALQVAAASSSIREPWSGETKPNRCRRSGWVTELSYCLFRILVVPVQYLVWIYHFYNLSSIHPSIPNFLSFFFLWLLEFLILTTTLLGTEGTGKGCVSLPWHRKFAIAAPPLYPSPSRERMVGTQQRLLTARSAQRAATCDAGYVLTGWLGSDAVWDWLQHRRQNRTWTEQLSYRQYRSSSIQLAKCQVQQCFTGVFSWWKSLYFDIIAYFIII